MFNMPPMPFL
jgi:hypothetical protein